MQRYSLILFEGTLFWSVVFESVHNENTRVFNSCNCSSTILFVLINQTAAEVDHGESLTI